MEIFAVVIFIVFCSALCHLVHTFYNRSTPFLLSLLAAICKINWWLLRELESRSSRFASLTMCLWRSSDQMVVQIVQIIRSTT